MKNLQKERRWRGILIILSLIIGIIIGKCCNFTVIGEAHAQDSEKESLSESEMDRATSSRHGYGSFLNFEYEIVTNTYGYFVVVKDRNSGALTTAGLN